MARLIAALACLTWAVAAEAFVFTDDTGKFVVRFPSGPRQSMSNGSSDLGPHVIVTWAVPQSDRHWSVVYVDYPVLPQRDYDRNVDAVIARLKGTLVRHHDLVVSGLPGREAVVAAGALVMRQRLVLVDRRLYMLIYVGPPGTETSPEVDAFLDSFRLLR